MADNLSFRSTEGTRIHLLLLGLLGILSGILMLGSGLDLSLQGTIALAAGLSAFLLGLRFRRWHAASEESDKEEVTAPGGIPTFAAASPADAEIPFAVIVPAAATTTEQFQAMGRAVVSWKSATPGISRILGLDRMSAGLPPLTGVEHFAISYWNDPQSRCVGVALIFVVKSSVGSEMVESLMRAVSEFGAIVLDPEVYSTINR